MWNMSVLGFLDKLSEKPTTYIFNTFYRQYKVLHYKVQWNMFHLVDNQWVSV